MSFDEIPENKIEGYLCACGGSITKCEDKWICDNCSFEKPVVVQDKKTTVQVWDWEYQKEL